MKVTTGSSFYSQVGPSVLIRTSFHNQCSLSPVPVKWTSWVPNGTLEFAVPKNIHGLLCTIIWIQIDPKGDFRKKVYHFVGDCACQRVGLSTAYHITYTGYKVDFNNPIMRFRNMEEAGFSKTPVNNYQITCHKTVYILQSKTSMLQFLFWPVHGMHNQVILPCL